MKKLSTNKIRSMWLDFFESKKHLILEPCSLIPVNDNSLLWINSGMATLKPYFEGNAISPSSRLCNSQKVLRTNDIKHIGHDTRHLTFFEMLGNFSIGDYFKKEAITWAWEFLISPKWLNLNPNKLYITVYEKDIDSYNIWINFIKIPLTHIFKASKNNNFWQIGEGPSGPNTEIFYDRGVKYDLKKIGPRLIKEDIENNRYLEIWNIVFSEFYFDGKDTYSKLPKQNIDTGAGLERLACILQNTYSSFETDNFLTIIKKIESLTNIKYDLTNWNNSKNKHFRIISDHIRTITMTISDGEYPSNKDRGYIIRRLIRRSISSAYFLNIKEPFLYKLVKIVISTLGSYYKDLEKNYKIIKKVIFQEELKFNKILINALNKFYQLVNQKSLTIPKLFELYSTFGLSFEIIQANLININSNFNLNELKTLIQKHQLISKKNQEEKQGFDIKLSIFNSYQEHTQNLYEKYDEIKESKITAIFYNNKNVNSIENEIAFLVLDKTPFYGEKGGQIGDQGIIKSKYFQGKVIDVQINAFENFIHKVNIIGKAKIGDIVNAKVDAKWRASARQNHSGTHILHAAIRDILGKEAKQKGSYNCPDFLRIDINYFGNIALSNILDIEKKVNEKIQEKLPCEIIFSDYKTAINKHKALAFFVKKYTDIVRTVKFGDYSIELCGGTHCHATNEIEQLLITNVESKGLNIYRFHALTSYKRINQFIKKEILNIQKKIEPSVKFYLNKNKFVKNTNLNLIIEQINFLKFTTADWRKCKDLFKNFQKNYKIFLKQFKEFKISTDLKSYYKLPLNINKNVKYLCQYIDCEDINLLKKISDFYQNKYFNLVVLLYMAKKDTKNNYLFICSSSSQKISAKNIINKFIKIKIDEKVRGGGSLTFAQGSFSFETPINNIKKKLENFISND